MQSLDATGTFHGDVRVSGNTHFYYDLRMFANKFLKASRLADSVADRGGVGGADAGAPIEMVEGGGDAELGKTLT